MEDARTWLIRGVGAVTRRGGGGLQLKRLVPGGAEGSAENGGRAGLLAIDDDNGKGVWEAEELALGEAGCAGDWRG